jgi:predicted transcriptional regulator of viral defense system
MKSNQGLTPNQERLQSILEYKKYKVIKRKELLSLISEHRISRNPKYLVKSMLLKNRLVFFKRENYIVIPMSSINKAVEIDEFKLNELFLESNSYYIGLYNAFNLHGFTEQIPNKMFVFNTKYSADRKILHYNFKYFKIKKNKLFGVLKKYDYPYSDKERTIIDALDYPQYLGGLSKVILAIKDSKYDKQKLEDYSIRYGSIKVMKLVGLIVGSERLIRLLKQKKALSYYTTVKNSGEKMLDKQWKIRMT